MKHLRSWQRWIGLLFFGWTMAVWPAMAAPGDTGILIDASGSMEGFFRTSSIYILHDDVRKSIDGPTSAYYFTYYRPDGRRGGLIPYSGGTGGRPDTKNTVTLIDRAYEEARKRQFSALWLITDNIQEAAGLQQERNDITLFYNKLKRDDVHIVYFFPVQRDFDGALYAEDGETKLPTPYRDRRGVVVYAILFDKRQEGAFRSAVQQAEKHLGAPAIQAIPLLRRVQGAARETESAILQTWDAEENAKIPQPYRLQRADPPADEMKLYSEPQSSNTTVAGTFVVRFTSRLAHVRINNVQVKATLDKPFTLAGVAQTTPTLQPEPEAIPTLRPDQQSGNIEVRIRFPQGLTLHDPQACSGLSTQPGQYEGKIKVALAIKKEHVKLDDDEQAHYSTADQAFFRSTDPRYHQRIYGLEYLVRDLPSEFQSGNVTETSDKVYTVVFRLSCPIPSSFWASLLGGLAGLGAIGVLGWLLRRSPGYRLTAEDGGVYRLWIERASGRRVYDDTGEYEGEPQEREAGEVVHLPFLSFGRSHPIHWPDRTVADLKRSLLGRVYVRARPGFVIDGVDSTRTLNPSASGDSFAVTERTGRVTKDSFTEPPRSWPRQRSSRLSSDEIYSEDDF